MPKDRTPLAATSTSPAPDQQLRSTTDAHGSTRARKPVMGRSDVISAKEGAMQEHRRTSFGRYVLLLGLLPLLLMLAYQFIASLSTLKDAILTTTRNNEQPVSPPALGLAHEEPMGMHDRLAEQPHGKELLEDSVDAMGKMMDAKRDLQSLIGELDGLKRELELLDSKMALPTPNPPRTPVSFHTVDPKSIFSYPIRSKGCWSKPGDIAEVGITLTRRLFADEFVAHRPIDDLRMPLRVHAYGLLEGVKDLEAAQKYHYGSDMPRTPNLAKVTPTWVPPSCNSTERIDYFYLGTISIPPFSATKSASMCRWAFEGGLSFKTFDFVFEGAEGADHISLCNLEMYGVTL